MPTLYGLASRFKSETGKDVALLFSEGGDVNQMVYVAQTRVHRRPFSCVTTMLQQQAEGRRGPALGSTDWIYTTAPLTDMERGMAHLSGKLNLVAKEDNYSVNPGRDPSELREGYRPPEFAPGGDVCGNGVDLTTVSPAYAGIHRLYAMTAFAIVSSALSGTSPMTHSIGAILVDKSGTILGWAVNTNHKNKTQHAETNLLQSYFMRTSANQLPEGARIYTTLKPCKMCAGMIVACAGTDYRVFYAQNDPGFDASGTALPNDKTELIGSGGQSKALHVIDPAGGQANMPGFAAKGRGTAQAANLNVQTFGQNGVVKVDLASSMQDKWAIYKKSNRDADNLGATGFLDNSDHATGLIKSTANRLYWKLERLSQDPNHFTKYGGDANAVKAVIKHIRTYISQIAVRHHGRNTTVAETMNF